MFERRDLDAFAIAITNTQFGETMSTASLARTTADLAPTGFAPLTAAGVRAQVNLIQEVMREVMTEGEHYGKIPGCGDKPALFKAGAEKLGLTFRLIPTFKVDLTNLPNGHREYGITCTLTTPAGEVVGEGVGCCSTMESKYRWRSSVAFEVTDQNIPNDARDKKAEYRKKGFGMRQVDGAWVWVKYTGTGERQEHPDIADCYNTVLKMAKKRAHVDAVLTTTAASDIFTQDVEERPREASDEAGGTKPAPVKDTHDPAPLDLIHKLHTVWLARKGWRNVMAYYKLPFPPDFKQPTTDADLAAMQAWLSKTAATFLHDGWQESDRVAKEQAEKRNGGAAKPKLHPGDENSDPEPEFAGDAQE